MIKRLLFAFLILSMPLIAQTQQQKFAAGVAAMRATVQALPKTADYTYLRILEEHVENVTQGGAKWTPDLQVILKLQLQQMSDRITELFKTKLPADVTPILVKLSGQIKAEIALLGGK
jgi:hypothetical protein